MDDIRDLPIPVLADEITSLAGHLAAGTCRFLELVAAFDEGGGWQGTGLRSCAQWLSWKCGLSTGTAHEQLRVARALSGLPRVREAFAAGQLSYSKARALTRVATADDEEMLVAIATGCTAAQLDRLCAGLARSRADREVVAQAVGSRFSAHWQPDGSLRFSGRLAAEDGAVLLAALAAVRSEPDPDADDDADDDSLDSASPGEAPGSARPAAAATVATVATVTTAADVAGRAARDDAFALVELARHALSAPAPAVGASPVRLIVHTTDQVLTEMSTPDESTPGQQEPPLPESSAGLWTTDQDSTTHDPGGERTPVAMTGGNTVGVLDAGPGIPLVPLGAATLRRILCEAIVENLASASLSTTTRYANSRQRRTLLARDHGCAFPGCPRRRRLHAHHIQHWADGGSTSIDNLALLCERHHLLIHEGGWQLVRTKTGCVAVDPTGRTHLAAPPTAGDADRLLEAIPLSVPSAITGTWAGERLDLSYAIGVIEANAMLHQQHSSAA